MSNTALFKQALAAGEGVVRLAPCWVPRSFLMPGGRLKLDPRDLYALGAHRGGIDERWFSSTTNAANGPGTPADEGLSYIDLGTGKKALLKEAIETAGDEFLGAAFDNISGDEAHADAGGLVRHGPKCQVHACHCSQSPRIQSEYNSIAVSTLSAGSPYVTDST